MGGFLREREESKKATRIFPPFEDAIERRLYGSKEEEEERDFSHRRRLPRCRALLQKRLSPPKKES